MWLIVGLNSKESFGRGSKSFVFEEICSQCFEYFMHHMKKKDNNYNKNGH